MVTGTQITQARGRFWLWGAALGLIALGLALGAGLMQSQHSLPLPKWAVGQIETRLSGALQRTILGAEQGARVTISGIGLRLGRDFAPRLVLQGVSFQNAASVRLLDLPQIEAGIALASVMRGPIRFRHVAVIGADLHITRDAAGQLNITIDQGGSFDLPALFDLPAQMAQSPLSRDLTEVTAQGLKLRYTDLQSGQAWALHSGALRIVQDAGGLSADLTFAAQGLTRGQTGASTPSNVAFALSLPKTSGAAQMRAVFSGVPARDLAAQVAALGFMSVLDAPLSGQINATLTPQGLSEMRAALTLGAGQLAPDMRQTDLASDAAPDSAPKPAPFQSAQLNLAYDPDQGRIVLDTLNVASDVVSLRARGHVDMLRADGTRIKTHLAGEVPSSFVTQIQIESLRFARRDLFAEEVVFTAGAADLRLRLAPFSADIGQFSLSDGAMRITGAGTIGTEAAGWRAALDVTANEISAQKLLGVWPKTWLVGTRKWLDRNLLAGQFRNLRLAMRQTAGAAPIFDVGYHFDGLQLTALDSLPAIAGGAGYGSLRGRSFTTVLEEGRITPPLGGEIDLAGSVFSIADTRQRPATGKLTLQSVGSLTATLSLINQPPFRFVSKAGQAVDFGAGTARLTTHLTLPLKPAITAPDVTLNVTGTVQGFKTAQLAAPRDISVPALDVFVDGAGLRLSGQGQISGAAFDGAYVQRFGGQAGEGQASEGQASEGRAGGAQSGGARIEAAVDLSADTLAAFGVRLPQGTVLGQGRGDVVIDLARNQPARMVLTSDLRGITLALPPVGYSKPAAQTGQLRAEITLSSPPEVTQLTVQAGDLQASGQVRLAPDGSLARAAFPALRLGRWLEADVTFAPPSAGAPLALALTNGAADLRFLPPPISSAVPNTGANGAGLPISLRLGTLRISDGITLGSVQGDFTAGQGGLSGNFTALLAGGAPIQGQLAPAHFGTAVRVTAQDAGAALAQAGIYTSARGGALDLVLTPRAEAGHYAGEVEMANIRVQGASALAELLNAISVVGLLEQLGGTGILFSAVTGQFDLTPQGVDLRDGVATGNSLGVTMQGLYRFAGQGLDMQGVISPVYILNGIGSLISRRGEGVLGFNYQLSGSANAPSVRVNPLSVLMPGFLRNLLKTPTPQFQEQPQ